MKPVLAVVLWLGLATRTAWGNLATKKCGDADCEAALFSAVAKRDFAQDHEDFLSFAEGQTIRVLAVDFSDRPDLWEGVSEDGRRGFFYRSHVKQNNYLGFLRQGVAEDRDLHSLLRERKPPPTVQKYQGTNKVRKVLGKALEVEEQRASAAGFPDGQPDPGLGSSPSPDPSATTPPPLDPAQPPPKLEEEGEGEGEEGPPLVDEESEEGEEDGSTANSAEDWDQEDAEVRPPLPSPTLAATEPSALLHDQLPPSLIEPQTAPEMRKEDTFEPAFVGEGLKGKDSEEKVEAKEQVPQKDSSAIESTSSSPSSKGSAQNEESKVSGQSIDDESAKIGEPKPEEVKPEETTPEPVKPKTRKPRREDAWMESMMRKADRLGGGGYDEAALLRGDFSKKTAPKGAAKEAKLADQLGNGNEPPIQPVEVKEPPETAVPEVLQAKKEPEKLKDGHVVSESSEPEKFTAAGTAETETVASAAVLNAEEIKDEDEEDEEEEDEPEPVKEAPPQAKTEAKEEDEEEEEEEAKPLTMRQKLALEEKAEAGGPTPKDQSGPQKDTKSLKEIQQSVSPTEANSPVPKVVSTEEQELGAPENVKPILSELAEKIAPDREDDSELGSKDKKAPKASKSPGKSEQGTGEVTTDPPSNASEHAVPSDGPVSRASPLEESALKGAQIEMTSEKAAGVGPDVQAAAQANSTPVGSRHSRASPIVKHKRREETTTKVPRDGTDTDKHVKAQDKNKDYVDTAEKNSETGSAPGTPPGKVVTVKSDPPEKETSSALILRDLPDQKSDGNQSIDLGAEVEERQDEEEEIDAEADEPAPLKPEDQRSPSKPVNVHEHQGNSTLILTASTSAPMDSGAKDVTKEPAAAPSTDSVRDETSTARNELPEEPSPHRASNVETDQTKNFLPTESLAQVALSKEEEVSPGPAVDGEAAEEASKAEAERVKREAEERSRLVAEAQAKAASEAAALKARQDAELQAKALENAAKAKAELDAKLKAAQEEKARLAEAEKARLAQEAEKIRLAAQEAEKARLAAEADKARLAAEAEKARLAAEAEKARLDAEATKKAEEERLARLEVEKEAELKKVQEEEAAARKAEEDAEALLKDLEGGPPAKEEDLEEFIRQKEAQIAAEKATNAIQPPAEQAPTQAPLDVPPLPTAAPPAPKRRITLGSALNHGHSHGPGGHGHAHGGHDHSHEPANPTPAPVDPPPPTPAPVTPPPVTGAASVDSFGPDSVVIEGDLPPKPTPEVVILQDTPPATPDPVAEAESTPTGQAEELPVATTLPPIDTEVPAPPEAEKEEGQSETKDELGNQYCTTDDCTQTLEEGTTPPPKPMDPANELPPDPQPGSEELPPHLRDIPPHLMKDAGLLPPEEASPGLGERLGAAVTPLIDALRTVLKGLRGTLPAAVGERVDELGLLMALLLVFVTLFHLILRLLDSSAGSRQRADLSRYVGLEKQYRTLRLENEALKKNSHSAAASQVANAGMETELRNLAEDKAELEDKKASLEADLKALKGELKTANSEASAAKASAEEAEAKLADVQRKFKTADAELSGLRQRAEEAEAAAQDAEKKLRKATSEAERTASALEESQEAQEKTEKELSEAKAESEAALDRAAKLEGEVEGLKTIVERLQPGKGGADSGESNGWSDLGAEDSGESEEKRRERLAQLTNAAMLHGQLKQARAEVERAKAAAQKEADSRVELELKLKEASSETGAKLEKLERTEQERSDLLKQVTQLTAIIAAKEADSASLKEELGQRAEALQREKRELESRLESEKDRRAAWEDKFADKEEAVQRLRKDLDRKENQFFHDLREKENRIRQLDMQNMQIRRHMAISSTGGNASFDGPASNNSSEAEMREFMSHSAHDRPNLSPAPASAADGWMLGKGSSVGGGSAAAWGAIPSAAASRRSGWQRDASATDPRYDSPSSNDWQPHSAARRSKRDKSRSRRSVADDGFAEEESARRHKRRSRSRGARSEAAPRAGSDDAPSPPPSDKHRRRSSRPRHGPSPVLHDNPYPLQDQGFDPIYGGPADDRRRTPAGPSPPPLLSEPLPPPNATAVHVTKRKGDKKKSKRDRD